MTRRLWRESGETLVELLLAIIIIGVAFSAVLTGMATAVMTSTQHRAQATANTYLLSAADAVKSETANPYTDCATPGAYDPTSGVTVPTGWSAASITDVQYWNGATFVGSCATDQKLQLVTVLVSSPDGKASVSTSFIKRNPA